MCRAPLPNPTFEEKPARSARIWKLFRRQCDSRKSSHLNHKSARAEDRVFTHLFRSCKFFCLTQVIDLNDQLAHKSRFRWKKPSDERDLEYMV
jgi:hypothetical protein